MHRAFGLSPEIPIATRFRLALTRKYIKNCWLIRAHMNHNGGLTGNDSVDL